MSYSVRYGTSKYDSSRFRKNRKLILSVCFLFVVVLACLIYPGHVKTLRSHLFPASDPSVQQAFQTMNQNVSEGESLHDAAVAFCREVLFASNG